MKKGFLKLILAIFLVFFISGNFVSAEENKIEIKFFYSESCPFCKIEKPFLENLAKKYQQIELKEFEISNKENADYFLETLKTNKVPEKDRGLIPAVFIGSEFFIGYRGDESTGRQIENLINSIISGNGNSLPEKTNLETITLLGKEIRICSLNSLTALAVILGLADGINPCMFSVLLLLLAYLLSFSNQRKMLKSGILFSISVFLIYFILMAGIYFGFSRLQNNFLPFVAPIKMFLGVILFLVGALMARDFFFKKPGEKVSFAIPDFAHPVIKKLISLSSYPAVIFLALFSSLIELPCTFALPLGFVAVLSEKGVAPYFYLILYNLFFILPLLLITGIIIFGFSKIEKVEQWEERTNTLMRLISGILLLILGIAFLLRIF
jgi:thiol-disulfide isomerase/thioredoxin